MGGANNRSLISAHFCISAYFLTAETYPSLRYSTPLSSLISPKKLKSPRTRKLENLITETSLKIRPLISLDLNEMLQGRVKRNESCGLVSCKTMNFDFESNAVTL